MEADTKANLSAQPQKWLEWHTTAKQDIAPARQG